MPKKNNNTLKGEYKCLKETTIGVRMVSEGEVVKGSEFPFHQKSVNPRVWEKVEIKKTTIPQESIENF